MLLRAWQDVTYIGDGEKNQGGGGGTNNNKKKHTLTDTLSFQQMQSVSNESTARRTESRALAPVAEVVVVKVVEEVEELFNLGRLGEKRGAKVPCAGYLAKARARDDADASALEKLLAVNGVRGSVAIMGNGSLGNVDAREGVHGTVAVVAGDALDAVEALNEHLRAEAELVLDARVLLVPLVVRGVARGRRVDHDLGEDLAGEVGAEIDGHELVDLVADEGVDIDHLHVATTEAALAVHALGNGVEANELDGRFHVSDNLLKGDEWAVLVVGVFLVHLIGQEDEAVVLAELNNLAHHVLRENLARRIARVDDADGADLGAERLGRGEALLQLTAAKRPAVLLFKVVVDSATAEQRNGGRVERVLRHRHHDTIVYVTDKEVEHGLDRLGCAVGNVDLLGVGLVSIAVLDEAGHRLADE
eukprot:m.298092 g.298092  ORF g.298092 m.298092 type:complete len:418 (-) comp13779_c0_seq1:654-1907(-)